MESAGSGVELGFVDGGVERRAPLAACADLSAAPGFPDPDRGVRADVRRFMSERARFREIRAGWR